MTSKELQEVTDATKACEQLEQAAIDRQIETPVESISLMFMRDLDNENIIDIDLPLSIRDELINILRPLLEKERKSLMEVYDKNRR